MITCKPLITAFLFAFFTTAYAQQDHPTEKNRCFAMGDFNHVLTQALSDPELKDYKMASSVMTLGPCVADTLSHRHDCDVFGYVLEGDVMVALETGKPNVFSAGQMFYEKRNILHTVTANMSKEKPARILLIFIIKNGRNGYIAEYD